MRKEKKGSYIKLALILVCFIIVPVLILYRGSLIGAHERAFNMPDILKEKENAFVLMSDAESRNELKKSFYLSYKKSDEFAGLKQLRASIEGTPITLYLMTEFGNLTLIFDYTHDPFSNRKIIVEKGLNLLIGTMDQNGNFVEADFFEIADTSAKKVKLKVIRSTGEEIII